MGTEWRRKPTDAILTLEEALMRQRKREEAGHQSEARLYRLPLDHSGGSGTVHSEGAGKAATYREAAEEERECFSDASDDRMRTPRCRRGGIVAVIEGIPRTLAGVERTRFFSSGREAYDRAFQKTRWRAPE